MTFPTSAPNGTSGLHAARRAGRTGRWAVGMLLMAGLLCFAASAEARQGVYVGFGAGNLQVTDGLAGDRTVEDLPAAPTHELRLGQLDTGSGLALNGGFGFNEYVALDLLANFSRHTATYTPTAGATSDYTATVSAVTFGVRGAVPLGDAVEVFGRFGLGGYEVTYREANIRLADSRPVDDARLTGRGFAAGVGTELYFGHWALQVAYTVHSVRLSGINSLHFGSELKPVEDLSLASAAVLLTYYLE